jgi:hypothetical protein
VYPTEATYYTQREEFVAQNHKNLFMRPSEVGIRQTLKFSNTPSSHGERESSFTRKFISFDRNKRSDRKTDTVQDYYKTVKENNCERVKSKPKTKKSKLTVIKNKVSKKHHQKAKVTDRNKILKLTLNSSTHRTFTTDSISNSKIASASYKSSLANSTKKQLQSVSKGSPSPGGGKPYVPISERLIMNSHRPYQR